MHSLGIALESFGKQQEILFKVIDSNSHWVLESDNKTFPFKVFFQLIDDNLLVRSAFTFEAWRIDYNQVLLYANYLNELSSMGVYHVQVSNEEIADQLMYFTFSLRLDCIDSETLSLNLPTIYSHFNLMFILGVAYLIDMINAKITLDVALESFENKLKEN